ncbi:hypothetical protein BJY52DRAFT_1192573 [Lactarius psammicola]|nr:hypothetical protein BJY52DRAFT_1192573 [Lactarius psammicola]
MVQPDRDPEAPGVPTVTKTDSSELRIPNVYTNGLPPNFPEEQLYAFTKHFGGVVSVRTFTRHVSDRHSYALVNPCRSHPLKLPLVQRLWLCPVRMADCTLLGTITSYSFLRVNTIESAEKSFDGIGSFTRPFIRQNLHPIPSTHYAFLSSSGTWLFPSSSSPGSHGDSFKSRIGRLKDETSINSYIEGLPLSTDHGSAQTPSVLVDQSEDLPWSLNNLGLRSAFPAKESVPRATSDI